MWLYPLVPPAPSFPGPPSLPLQVTQTPNAETTCPKPKFANPTFAKAKFAIAKFATAKFAKARFAKARFA